MNNDSNKFNPDCELVLFYYVNSRLTVLVDRIRSIGDLKPKVFKWGGAIGVFWCTCRRSAHWILLNRMLRLVDL